MGRGEYLVEAGVAAIATSRVAWWPTNCISSFAHAPQERNSSIEEKNLALWITFCVFFSFLVVLPGWSSVYAVAAWATVFSIGSVASVAIFFTTKDHLYLRIWLIVSGTLFLLAEFFAEGCKPLASTGGTVFVPMLLTVFFLPQMGARFLIVLFCLSVHGILFVIVAVIEWADMTCYDPGTKPTSSAPTLTMFYVVVPFVILLWTQNALVFRREEEEIQSRMSDEFGRKMLRAALKKDFDAMMSFVKEYDETETPNPSMADDALCAVTELIEELRTRRRPSFRVVETSSRDQGGLLTSPQVGWMQGDRSSASGDSGDELPKIVEEKIPAAKRRTSRMFLLENDGEVASGNPSEIMTPVHQVSRTSSFLVVCSLPLLRNYTTKGNASLDLVKILLTEYTNNFDKVLGDYGGEFLFGSFSTFYASFEAIGCACAAAVAFLELQNRDSTHHKDPLLNETAGHRPFVLVLHADSVRGNTGLNENHSTPIVDSAAEPVIFKILDTLSHSILNPPVVVIAASLRAVASSSFEIQDSPHPSLAIITAAKECNEDGLPVIPPSGEFDFGIDRSYALPEIDTEEVAQGIINAAKPRRRSSSQNEMNSSSTRPKKKKLPVEVLDVWNRFDADRNGVLDVDEIREVLNDLGMTMTNEELHSFFDEVDADHSGTVSQEEFSNAFFSSALGGTSVMAGIRRAATAMAQKTGVDNLPIILNAWKKYDADASGSLESNEIRLLLNDLGMPHTEEEVLWLVQKMDKNGNGKIDFDEFVSMFSEDDTANKKLNAVKERIQTVSRVMNNKSSGKIYTNEDQTLRDRRIALNNFFDVYLTWPLFIYINYTSGTTLVRCAMGSDDPTPRVNMYVDLALDALYLTWVVMKCCLLPTEERGQVVFHTKEIFQSASKTLDFYLDILTVLPLDIIYLVSGVGMIGYWRVNKLLSLYYVDSTYKKMTVKLNPAIVRAVNALMYLFLLSHLLGCGFIWAGRFLGEEVLADVVGTKKLITDSDTRYPTAFLAALLTLAGQLKGEAIPDNETLLAILVVAVLFGLPIYTVVLGTIGNAVNVETSETRFLTKMDDLRGYFEYTKLPKQFETESIAFYRHLYETTGSLDILENPLDDLPVELSIQVTITIGREMLKKVPIFKDACDNLEFVHELTTKLIPKVIEPSFMVMKKGQRGTNMYFITYGDFDIITDDGKVVFTLRKGNFFGEIALLHNVKRTATIVCGPIRYANVLMLDKKQFDEVTATFPDCLSQVYKAAEERIKQILDKEVEEAKAAKEKRKREREEHRRKEAEERGALQSAPEESSSSEEEEEHPSRLASSLMARPASRAQAFRPPH